MANVTMKGATSGDKYNYLPNTSKPFDKQPPQDTASSADCGSNVQWCQNTGNRDSDASAPMPTCATPDDTAI